MATTTDKELLEYVAKRNKKIEKLFDQYIIELAKAGIPYDKLSGDEIFKYSKYPNAAQAAAKIAAKMRKALRNELLQSITGSIALACRVVGDEFKPYTRMSDNALDTFRNEVTKAYIDGRVNTEKGLSLSDRVWNYTEQSKKEFELALSQIIEDGIRKGASAEEIGRAVRSKLRNPDMMYRRYHVTKTLKDGTKKKVVEWRRKVVDSDSKVHFVKEDLAKTGRGVYRSARQNALRMAGTEMTGAYRYAENMRYQTEPFVIGIRIKLSNNHTCKDKNGKPQPFHDICDDLAGDYPKWFLWKGWHPRCRCYTTAILCSDEEMRELAKLTGDDYKNYVSPSTVKDMPSNYNEYMEYNADRVAGSVERGTQPYWIRDNYIDGDPTMGFKARTAPVVVKPVATQEQYTQQKSKELREYKIRLAAEERHAKRNADDIQRRWDIDRIEAWEFKPQYFETDYSEYDLDKIKKKLDYLYVSAFDTYMSDAKKDSLSQKSACLFSKYLAEKANSRIKDLAKDYKIKNEAIELLNLYPDMPKEAVAQLRKYLNNCNSFKDWNYYNRLVRNREGVANLGFLLMKKADFNVISANMPHQLLPNSKLYPMNDHILDKRLFDSLRSFIPVKIDTNGGGAAYGNENYIHLNRATNRGKYNDIQVIYHEYGHALDQQYHYDRPEVDAYMTTLREQIEQLGKFTSYDEKLAKDFKEFYYGKCDKDYSERIMAVMDTIQSITAGKHGCCNLDGHEKSYWEGDFGKEYCHTEFVAHMSEFFFFENEYAKNFNKDMHDKMIKLFEKVYILNQ